MKMEAVFPTDTPTYVTTQCPNSKDHNVNLAFCSLPLEQNVTSELFSQRSLCAGILLFGAFSKTFHSYYVLHVSITSNVSATDIPTLFHSTPTPIPTIFMTAQLA